MTSTANLIEGRKSPSPLAIESAIKADLHRLAQKVSPTPTGGWPGSSESAAYERMCRAVGLALLTDGLKMPNFTTPTIRGSQNDATELVSSIVDAISLMHMDEAEDLEEAAQEIFGSAEHLFEVLQHLAAQIAEAA